MRLDPAGVPLLNRGRRAIRARCVIAAASGLALLLAAGCSNSGSPGGAVSNTVVIAAVPGVSDAAIYLAEKDGLFAAEGLEHVQIQTYKNQAAVLNALENAKADIAASDYGDVFNAQAQQQPAHLRILADGYDATAGSLEILTLPGSRIQNPTDLTQQKDNPGLTIGVPDDDWLGISTSNGAPSCLAAGSLYVAAACDVLTNFVGNVSEFVTWKPMTQQKELTELQSGQLKAILVSEPYIYQAESRLGAVEVLDACSGETAGLPLLGYVSQDAWVKQNPGAVADFQAALAKAEADASLAGQAQRVLHSATGLSVESADLVTIGTYPTSTNISALQSVVTLMDNEKTIDTNSADTVPNVNQMVVKSQS